MLSVVPFQLLLFPDARQHNWHPSPKPGQGLREKRTARQWIDSVVAYLRWRSGEPWRDLSAREHRWCQERRDYLDAIRLIQNAFHLIDKPKGLHVPLPVLNVAPPPLPTQLKLAELPRKTLVEALLRENPALTDKKLLMTLRREKLARMLAETRIEAHKARPERLRA